VKVAKYETSPGALAALLATRSFVMADLYTFTLAGGRGSLLYTTADTDIGYSGQVWTHGGPLFDQLGTRATGHWKLGLDTDTWQCQIAPRAVDPVTGALYPDKIGDQPWLQAVLGGALAGAVVTVDRAYFPTWPTMPRAVAIAPTGVVTIFVGRVAVCDVGRSAVAIQLNSHLELLDQQMPINVYGASCRHVLFDAGCGAVASTYAMSGTVGTVVSRSNFTSSLAAPAGSGTYQRGQIVFTSGSNAGFRRSVKAWAAPSGVIDGAFQLLAPMPFAISPGDGFTAYPGCDRQLMTCAAFWGGSADLHFGGEPYIPAPETAT
jgi:hypothetical protein